MFWKNLSINREIEPLVIYLWNKITKIMLRNKVP